MYVHESNVSTWFFEFEAGDGTLYRIHVQSDYHGGWLVAWPDVGALFSLSDDLEEMKVLTKQNVWFQNPYHDRKFIHQALRTVAWGPYINGSDE